ncbi:Uncharacterised protein [Mycobacteroides abscessus]|nr:Uncharacterised protein [Mycobacteroides abscessus]
MPDGAASAAPTTSPRPPRPARDRTFCARASAPCVCEMPSSTDERCFSAFLIASHCPCRSVASASANTCGWRRTSFAARSAATSSTVNGSGSSLAMRAWNSTCRSRSPSSSRIPARSSVSMASASSCASSRRYRTSETCVCSRSHGHPPGA